MPSKSQSYTAHPSTFIVEEVVFSTYAEYEPETGISKVLESVPFPDMLYKSPVSRFLIPIR